MPSNVLFVIDLDGFMVNGVFLCKEAAVYNLINNTVDSEFFSVGEIEQLSEKDKKSVRFVKAFVHGLRFRDIDGDRPQEELYSFIRSYAAQARSWGMTVGYKGGSLERNILTELGYGDITVNLEIFNCPKFDDLVKGDPIRLAHYDCGRHSAVKDMKNKGYFKTAHCPRVEVACFGSYIIAERRKINYEL